MCDSDAEMNLELFELGYNTKSTSRNGVKVIKIGTIPPSTSTTHHPPSAIRNPSAVHSQEEGRTAIVNHDPIGPWTSCGATHPLFCLYLDSYATYHELGSPQIRRVIVMQIGWKT